MVDELLKHKKEKPWHSELTNESWDPRLDKGPKTLGSDPDILSRSYNESDHQKKFEALNIVCNKLLGEHVTLDNLSEIAESVLIPVDPKNYDKNQGRLIIPSASDEIDAYYAEKHYYSTRGESIGIDPAISARELAGASTNDTVVISGNAAREINIERELEDDEVPSIDLGKDFDEYYYTIDALLRQAIDHNNRNVTRDRAGVVKIIEQVRNFPERPIRVYVLDHKMQIFLTWLSNQVDKPLNIEANAPSASDYWNHKGILYPELSQIEELDEEFDSEFIKKELGYSRLGRLSEFSGNGVHRDLVPGYWVKRNGEDEYEYKARMRKALSLLNERHGIDKFCLKLSHSSDAGGVWHSLDYERALTQIDQLTTDKGVVIEPHFTYSRFNVGSDEFELCPSAHIVNGEVRECITTQFTVDGEWRGNTTISEDGFYDRQGSAILSSDDVRFFKESMRSIAYGIEQIENYTGGSLPDGFKDLKGGLRKAGMDFGVGSYTLDGKEIRVRAPQDPNFRTTGAEIAYDLREKHRNNGEEVEVSTWVIKPEDGVTYQQILEACRDLGGKVVASVQPGWGMIYAIAPDSYRAASSVLQLRDQLKEKSLIA